MDTDPRVRWFGPTWHAPINEVTLEAPTPVDDVCIYCNNPILLGQRGILMWGSHSPTPDWPWLLRVAEHITCFFASVGIPGRVQ